MSVKVKDLRVGDVLHDVHRHKAGNTTMSVEGHWTVQVIAVGEDERGPWADLSWNGSPARRERGTTGYKRWPKEWIMFDIYRGRRCGICYAKEVEGHSPTCEHPRAISARKRAAKESA